MPTAYPRCQVPLEATACPPLESSAMLGVLCQRNSIYTAACLVVFGLRTAACYAVDPKPAVSEFDRQIRPVLAKYCTRCHGAAKPKGDIDLQRFQGEVNVVKDREVWEAVLENVRSHAMPPEKQAAPTAEERDRIVKWIDDALSRADASGQRDPGRVTMRRLNRAEYNNTIRDLVGVTFHPADDFPSDDVGYGFDNIGDVLSLPTILLEKYLAAAEKIAREAILTEETQKTPVKQYDARKMDATNGSSPFQDWAQVLATNGELSKKHHFAKAGDYLFRIRAWPAGRSRAGANGS